MQLAIQLNQYSLAYSFACGVLSPHFNHQLSLISDHEYHLRWADAWISGVKLPPHVAKKDIALSH